MQFSPNKHVRQRLWSKLGHIINLHNWKRENTKLLTSYVGIYQWENSGMSNYISIFMVCCNHTSRRRFTLNMVI